jgi:hypothetical protein
MWADKSSATTSWSPPGSLVLRDTEYGTGTGYVSSAVADSGTAVGLGVYPAQTAAANAASARAAMWSIVLAP